MITNFEKIEGVVALLYACVEKRGGTTGVLNRKADDGWRKEIERERQTYVRVTECRDTALRHRGNE